MQYHVHVLLQVDNTSLISGELNLTLVFMNLKVKSKRDQYLYLLMPG